MQPAIRDGALIRVKPIAPAKIRFGDIILYRREGGVIAHRVVALTRHRGQLVGLTTRGDASSTCDAPVQLHQVLGKVVAVEGQTIEHMIMVQKLKLSLKRWYARLVRLSGFQLGNFLK